jgi:hypothetical protein
MTAASTPHVLTSAPTAAADDALRAATKLAVVTDDEDAHLAATRRLGAQLAARHDLDVVLYDRSQETWMDHPHPSGPCDVSELDDRAASHLAPQIEEFTALGIDAAPWIATVPTITEIVDVIRELGVDLILLPEQLDKASLIDRLRGKQPADVVREVAALNLERPVPVLVDRGGTVEVVG